MELPSRLAPDQLRGSPGDDGDGAAGPPPDRPGVSWPRPRLRAWPRLRARPGRRLGSQSRLRLPAGPVSRCAGKGSEPLDWLLWVLTRAVLVVIITWGVHPQDRARDDLAVYARWAAGALQHDRLPTDDMWQYPPLAGPVLWLGAAMPGGRVGFELLFLLVDAVVMAMVCGHARRTALGTGRRLWALLPLLGGSLLLARFDVVPTAFAVAALLLASRPVASGALAAVGAWVKVWPVLVLAGLRRRDLPRGVLGALTAGTALAVVIVGTLRDSMSFVGAQRGRGLQVESPAAWPFLLARQLGVPLRIRLQYGADELVGPGVAPVARLLPLLTLGLLAVVAVQRLRGRLEGFAPADVALAAVLFSIVSSRVFSPQYYVWVLGLAAVALGDPHTRMRRTIALVVGSSVVAQVVYPFLYAGLEGRSVPALVIHTVRLGLMLAATVTAARVLLRGAKAPVPLPSPVPATDDDGEGQLSPAGSI